MLNGLKICLTVLLLLCSINLFGQTITPIDSLVTIDIATIRKANEKLIELNYLKETIANKDSIIYNYKKLSEKQDSLAYKYQIKNISLNNELSDANEINKELNKIINKKNTIIAVFGGITTASLITTIICLITRK